MKCPVCGTIWKEGYMHCAYCGAELSPIENHGGSAPKAAVMRRCEICGRSLPAHYRFCDYCGTAAVDQENDSFSQEAVPADVRPEIQLPVVSESVDLPVQESVITEEQVQEAENIFEDADNQEMEAIEENTPEEQPEPEEPAVPTITFVQDDAEEYDEYDEADYDESDEYDESDDGDVYEEYEDSDDYYDEPYDDDSYDMNVEDEDQQDGESTRIFDSHAVNAAAAQVNAKVHLCDYDEFARQDNRSIGIHNPRASSGDEPGISRGFGSARYVLAWLLGLLAVAASVAAPVYSQNGGLIPKEYSCVLTDSMAFFRQMQLPDVWWVVFTAATLIPALLLVVFSSARRRTACMISSELGLLLPLAAWAVKTAVSQVKINSIGNSSLQIGFFAILIIHIIVMTILAAGRRSSGRRD